MRPLWLLGLLLAVGCVPPDDDDDSSAGGPRIHIFTYPPSDPPVVAFGEVEIGATGERSFDVQNIGDEPLDITAVTTSPNGASFVLVGLADLAAGIEVESQVTIQVRYVPEEQEVAVGTVSVASSDPVQPIVDISLSAEAIPPAE